MRRAKLALGFLVVGLLGLTAGAWLRTAEAKPSSVHTMVSVNGTDVYRFADVAEGFTAVCYVLPGREPYGGGSISCVKR